MPSRQHLLPADLDIRVKAFGEWLVATKHKAKRTAKIYVRVVRRTHAEFGSDFMNAIDWFARNWWPNTVPIVYAAFLQWADFTNDASLTASLKAFPLPAKRERKGGIKLPLSSAGLDKVFAAVEALDDPIAKNVLGIVLKTGRRLVDVLRVEREAIYNVYLQMQQGEVGGLHYQGKGGKIHSVAVRDTNGNDIIWEQLRVLYAANGGKWKRLADLVIESHGDSAQQEETAASKLRDAFKLACESVNVPYGIDGGVHPHRIRRTFADLIAEETNGDPVKIMRAMGWSSLSTAQKYLDHPKDDQTADLFGRVGPR